MERFQNTAITWNDALLLLRGLGVTLGVWSASMLIGIALGFALALIRRERIPVLSLLVVIYVETFRNSPLLVQLFLVFFGLPMVLGFGFDPITAALLTLSVNTSAFITVIVVASLDGVPKGQWEAAAAFGLTYWGRLRDVILPQAVRSMIPPSIVLAVGQLQVSSLVALINVMDLTKVGSILNIRTLDPFLIWPLVALFYFAVSKPLSMLGAAAERRLQLKSAWITERGQAL
jgi:His/Glu/Gln/Arg/opine family amino acid ABC transporter permease subunit